LLWSAVPAGNQIFSLYATGYNARRCISGCIIKFDAILFDSLQESDEGKPVYIILLIRNSDPDPCLVRFPAWKRVGRWWAARSSKPVWGVRNFPGGFDSHALPPIYPLIAVNCIMICQAFAETGNRTSSFLGKFSLQRAQLTPSFRLSSFSHKLFPKFCVSESSTIPLSFQW
jgi:hypothetical protein